MILGDDVVVLRETIDGACPPQGYKAFLGSNSEVAIVSVEPRKEHTGDKYD
jgi:hypothetical protein